MRRLRLSVRAPAGVRVLVVAASRGRPAASRRRRRRARRRRAAAAAAHRDRRDAATRRLRRSSTRARPADGRARSRRASRSRWTRSRRRRRRSTRLDAARRRRCSRATSRCGWPSSRRRRPPPTSRRGRAAVGALVDRARRARRLARARVHGGRASRALVAFALKRAAVELHAARGQRARCSSAARRPATPRWLERALRRGRRVVPRRRSPSPAASRRAPASASGRATHDPGAHRRRSTGVAIVERARDLVDAELARIGRRRRARLAIAATRRGAAPRRCAALAHVADLRRPRRRAARRRPAALAHAVAGVACAPRCVYDTTRFGTALVYARHGRRAAQPADGARRHDDAARRRRRRRCAIRSPAQRRPPISTSRDAARRTAPRVRVPLRDRAAASSTSTTASPTPSPSAATSPAATELSVGEIVARHQQARAAEDRALERHVVLARMEQHFRPTSTDPGFDVVTENRFFADRDGVEWEELSVLGQRHQVGRGSAGVPAAAAGEGAVAAARSAARRRLPLPPRRHRDRRRRAPATSSASTPSATSTATSLYRGTVWIDRETFRRRKLQAVQTGAVGAGRLERRDGALRPGRRRVGGRDDLPADRDGDAADRARRRPQHPGREDDALQRVPAQSRRTSRRGASRRGAAIASCTATPTSGMRYYVKEGDDARRQRQGHDQRQGDGDRHDDRSVVRLPAADPRHQLSRLRVRRPRLAARAAVRRRAGARQHPAAEAARHADRRQRRLLRHRRARQRSASTTPAGRATTSAC